MAECDLHTILRLPTGIFYAQGVKANVVFFDRRPAAADPWTNETWVYDLRTNKHFTLKTNPLRSDDLSDFVELYRPGDRAKRVETERFRRFGYDELIAREKANLDITWLRDESLDDASTLPAPGILAAEIVEELEAALAQFTELAASLPLDLRADQVGGTELHSLPREGS
jgi:type I restriction enzyme M protein